MLNLDDKEYDLNTLFSFEVLKEILLKLARNQVNLEEKVQNIINIYQNQEKSEKDDDLNFFETGDKFSLSEKEITSVEDKNKNENIETKEINLKENPEQSKTVISKKNEVKSEFKGKEKEKEKDKDKEKTEIKEEKDINEEKDNKDEIDLKKEESKNIGVSPDVITKMAKIIRQNKAKITSLENEIYKIKNNNKSHETSNQNDIDSINKKINQLSKKLSDQEDKLDNFENKCSDIDVLTMFKDNGNGTIDATKVMVKALEEKVFKKIETVENKNKSNSYLNDKMELVFSKIEKDRQNIENLYNLTGKNKELIDEINNKLKVHNKHIEKNAENLNKIKKSLKEGNDLINQQINELNEKIQNILKEIEELKKSVNNYPSELFKLSLADNKNNVDKEEINDINIKINDLRKKVNDIENSLKLYLDNNDLDNEVKNMKLILDKKISKEDLKELYNLHLSDVDEINDTNNKILSVYEQVKKNGSDIQGILKKIDGINANISVLQTYYNSGLNNTNNQPIIDFSKFIDNQKLTETIKPIIKEMEKMFQEIYSIRRELNDIDNLNKEFIKQTSLDRLEEKLTEKIQDLKLTSFKKYLDKAEHYKAIKNLEALIKVQVEENRKDADSWIMAKQPLKCFNCATCESNIKNVNPPNDFLPWNKYPPGDRIYRMGQGFSHMLQMMTNEFIKNIEKNSNDHSNNEQSYKSLNLNNINENGRINTNNNINREKTLLGLSVNNKEQIFDDSNIIQRKSGKLRLPVMTRYAKQKKNRNFGEAPVSDEERERDKDYNDVFDKLRIVSSPKIMKIMKKKAGTTNIFGQSETYDNSLNTENNININSGDIKQNIAKSQNYKS